jgi:Fe-S cluster assembly iron-binding protein IscA
MPRPQRITTVSIIFFALLALCIFALAPLRAYGQPPSVLTHHNDVGRTGQNLNEIVLNTTNVNAASFGKLFIQKVDGSIVAQPLYVPGVQLPNGTTHNVVYVATQHDSVFAFDADNILGSNATPLWTVNFPKSVPDDAANYGCGGVGYTEVGIMGTPVIDPTTNTLYVVSKTLVTGQYYFTLHALDITSGAEKFGGPVTINAAVQTSQGTINFTAAYQMQRPALLLLNGAVYIGFGSNGCDAYSYHGWLMAYSASTLQQLGVFITTPGGSKGSLWGSGGGPAADDEGFIYVSTANGTFDFSAGGTDLGDSMLQLNTVQNGFTVPDYFTPYNQATLDDSDLDLGSGGLLILPDQGGPNPHELVGGGKQGTLYLVDRDAMGGFNPIADNVLQEFVGITPSIKTVPAYWNGSIYLSGQNDYIKMFSLTSGVMSSAPVQETSVLFNDRGPSISISANGTSNGILWAMLHGTPVLYAFDATNLSNELYNTTQALKLRDRILSTSRFVTPTIVNGKVYVGGLTDLYVFGLLPSLAVTAGNNQSAPVGTTLPIPLTMQATDAYSQAGIPGVNVTCTDPGAGGKFSTASGVTDNSGNFSTNFTLGVKALTATVTCAATGYTSAVFTEVGVAGAPSVIKQFSGNAQSAPVDTQLPAPLVALVQDAHANPVSGVSVTFSDGGKGGSFTSSTVNTDVYGHATTFYTNPSKSGTVKVTASTPGVTAAASFTVTVTAPTSISITSGNNQSAAVGMQLSQALTVLVTDKNNNPIVNASVSFSDGGAGGSFSNPNPVLTGSNGTATQSYTLPLVAGTVSVTASATGLTQTAVFTESAIPGAAANVAIVGGNNQSGAAGAQLAQALTVEVTDQYGNAVPGVSVLFSDGGAGGTFSNANPSLTSGAGTVTQMYNLPTLAGPITITATAAAVANPATFGETAVAGNAANISVVSGNNQTAPNGTQLPQPLVVLVTDQYSNPVAGINVTFSDGGAGGTFVYANPVVTVTNGNASQFYILPPVAGETITIKATAAGVASPAIFTEYGQ